MSGDRAAGPGKGRIALIATAVLALLALGSWFDVFDRIGRWFAHRPVVGDIVGRWQVQLQEYERRAAENLGRLPSGSQAAARREVEAFLTRFRQATYVIAPDSVTLETPSGSTAFPCDYLGVEPFYLHAIKSGAKTDGDPLGGRDTLFSFIEDREHGEVLLVTPSGNLRMQRVP